MNIMLSTSNGIRVGYDVEHIDIIKSTECYSPVIPAIVQQFVDDDPVNGQVYICSPVDYKDVIDVSSPHIHFMTVNKDTVFRILDSLTTSIYLANATNDYMSGAGKDNNKLVVFEDIKDILGEDTTEADMCKVYLEVILKVGASYGIHICFVNSEEIFGSYDVSKLFTHKIRIHGDTVDLYEGESIIDRAKIRKNVSVFNELGVSLISTASAPYNINNRFMIFHHGELEDRIKFVRTWNAFTEEMLHNGEPMLILKNDVEDDFFGSAVISGILNQADFFDLIKVLSKGLVRSLKMYCNLFIAPEEIGPVYRLNLSNNRLTKVSDECRRTYKGLGTEMRKNKNALAKKLKAVFMYGGCEL